MNVTESIDARLSALPGKVGLYYENTADGVIHVYNGDEKVIAASVIKLFVMAEAFRQFEHGELQPDGVYVLRETDKLPSCGALSYMHAGLTVTWRDLVTLMIILSDNTATNILIDRLGMADINSMIDELGLTGTRLNRRLFQPELSRQGIENYITASDMGRFFRLLLDGQVVSPAASAEMLGILADQRLNGKLPFYLHSHGIPVAHKTGEDDGITHDVGVIGEEKPVILCIVSEGTDVPACERAMQDIAAMTVGLLPAE